MTTKDNCSEFAAHLRMFIDDTRLYNRTEWAEKLGVTESIIQQWINDYAFPKADSIRCLVAILRDNPKISDSIIEDLEKLLARPMRKITPHHEKKSEPTLAHYMVKPIREAFLRVLDALSPEIQEETLLKAADICRQQLDAPTLETVAERREYWRELQKTLNSSDYGRMSKIGETANVRCTKCPTVWEIVINEVIRSGWPRHCNEFVTLVRQNSSSILEE